MRTYLMTARERAEFDPLLFVQRLKEVGFVFDSEMCPVKIRQPWSQVEHADGSVTWTQEDV